MLRGKRIREQDRRGGPHGQAVGCQWAPQTPVPCIHHRAWAVGPRGGPSISVQALCNHECAISLTIQTAELATLRLLLAPAALRHATPSSYNYSYEAIIFSSHQSMSAERNAHTLLRLWLTTIPLRVWVLLRRLLPCGRAVVLRRRSVSATLLYCKLAWSLTYRDLSLWTQLSACRGPPSGYG